ncbi:hypothetical protein SAMD00019534_020500, partial [Acytostelium subglobosum LB1]|uniref:hypothetical protein n=1 Tax=Acytostelium subglobosum LB1 TaxID=1410327 RepID=UPI000644D82D
MVTTTNISIYSLFVLIALVSHSLAACSFDNNFGPIVNAEIAQNSLSNFGKIISDNVALIPTVGGIVEGLFDILWPNGDQMVTTAIITYLDQLFNQAELCSYLNNAQSFLVLDQLNVQNFLNSLSGDPQSIQLSFESNSFQMIGNSVHFQSPNNCNISSVYLTLYAHHSTLLLSLYNHVLKIANTGNWDPHWINTQREKLRSLSQEATNYVSDLFLTIHELGCESFGIPPYMDGATLTEDQYNAVANYMVAHIPSLDLSFFWNYLDPISYPNGPPSKTQSFIVSPLSGGYNGPSSMGDPVVQASTPLPDPRSLSWQRANTVLNPTSSKVYGNHQYINCNFCDRVRPTPNCFNKRATFVGIAGIEMFNGSNSLLQGSRGTRNLGSTSDYPPIISLLAHTGDYVDQVQFNYSNGVDSQVFAADSGGGPHRIDIPPGYYLAGAYNASFVIPYSYAYPINYCPRLNTISAFSYIFAEIPKSNPPISSGTIKNVNTQTCLVELVSGVVMMSDCTNDLLVNGSLTWSFPVTDYGAQIMKPDSSIPLWFFIDDNYTPSAGLEFIETNTTNGEYMIRMGSYCLQATTVGYMYAWTVCDPTDNTFLWTFTNYPISYTHISVLNPNGCVDATGRLCPSSLSQSDKLIANNFTLQLTYNGYLEVVDAVNNVTEWTSNPAPVPATDYQYLSFYAEFQDGDFCIFGLYQHLFTSDVTIVKIWSTNSQNGAYLNFQPADTTGYVLCVVDDFFNQDFCA